MTAIEDERTRLTDLYASGERPKAEYVAANIALDQELGQLKREKSELDGKRPGNGYGALDASVRRFSDSAKARFERCDDFETKREFLIGHIKKVIYLRSQVTIVGSVPIEQGALGPAKLEFRIVGELDRAAIMARPRRIRPDDGRWGASKLKLVASMVPVNLKTAV